MNHAQWTRRTAAAIKLITVDAPDPDSLGDFVNLQESQIAHVWRLVKTDLKEIEQAEEMLAHGRLPRDYEDYELCGKDLGAARLAVLVIANMIAVRQISDAGHDPYALVVLGKALNSAATGTGVLYKQLRPIDIRQNTPEVSETDRLAKVVALHTLFEDDPWRVGALYDAAESLLGIERKKIRKMVENARGGLKKHKTFVNLQSRWHRIYSRMPIDRIPIDELLLM